MTTASFAPARQCVVCAPGIEFCRYDGLLDTFLPHAHPCYVVGLVCSGTRAMSCGYSRYILQPGDLVVFNPHDAHGCKPIGDAPFGYEGLRLGSRTVREILGCAPRFGGPLLRDTKFANAFAAVSACALERPHNQKTLTQALVALLALLPQARIAPPHPADNLDRIARVLLCTAGAPQPLDALASQLGLSRFAASRAFVQRFGLSPDAFMQSARVEHARRLLEEGTPPAIVAQLLAYSDQAHLTRMFRQRMGLTPGAYRHAHLDARLSSHNARKESA